MQSFFNPPDARRAGHAVNLDLHSLRAHARTFPAVQTPDKGPTRDKVKPHRANLENPLDLGTLARFTLILKEAKDA
jgi:hypothetical protein